MSELLVCKKQYNNNVGFYSFNPKDVIVWKEKIEKNNLYAVAKVGGSYVVVKVIGLADCLVDKVTLSGNAIHLIEIDEEQINGQTYDLRDLADAVNNFFGGE